MEINWPVMAMTLLGGLAIFLYGMDKMASSLKSVAGDQMKTVLGRLTTNRLAGVATGAGVTAVIQSSSVTTVMLVGFVTANLMTLSQSIGVILGADIGTTITAQIVAFKVTKYALLLVAAGFLWQALAVDIKQKQYGNLVMGLGMIFFGMGIMSDGMYPLRTYDPFIGLMQEVSNPLIGILVATLFTALVQSSSATMGVIIAMSLQGLITLEAGIALALGANVGTCATAGLAAIGKPRAAIQVAIAHVLFKLLGVALLLPVLPYFVDLVRDLSPVADASQGLTERLAEETPRQIANAHTLFNVGIAVLFLPFTNQFARLVEWMLPTPAQNEYELALTGKPVFLSEMLTALPGTAIDAARQEIRTLGDHVLHMLSNGFQALMENTPGSLQTIAEQDDKVDNLYAEILHYLERVSKQDLTNTQSENLSNLLTAANDLESIGDLIETDTVDIQLKRNAKRVVISEETKDTLFQLYNHVYEAVENAVEAVATSDWDLARKVRASKADFNDAVNTAEQYLAERLAADAPNRVATYEIEIEIVEKLKRMFYFARRVAKTAKVH